MAHRDGENETILGALALAEEESNVVQLRPTTKGKPHPFEAVEIMRYTMVGPPELWVSLGGPYIAPPGSNPGGRKPWQLVATFPVSECEAAVRLARELSADFDIRIVDLAGVLPNEPEAA